MRIMFVTEYYPPHIGGVEFVFRAVAEGASQRGNECQVVTCKVSNTKKYEEIRGVKIHRVWVPKKGDRYWFTFLAIPEVLKLARNTDVIHTTTFNGALPAWIASKLLRKKCVITVHEVWGGLWNSLSRMNRFSATLHRVLERIILSLPFDRHVCVSRSTRNCLRLFGVKDERLAVIYNGIDQQFLDGAGTDGDRVRRELGLADKFILLYYGRPGVSKGLTYLIKALPLIANTVPQVHCLLILGRQPSREYEDAMRLRRDLDIDGCMTVLDPVPRHRLPDYIAASDCVVVPSLTEGFGFSAAEACAMGKPVVASDVASLPEIVSGRFVLAEPRSPAAIAKGVEKVYKGETQDSSRKEFTWDECVERYLEIYAGLVNEWQ